MDNELRELLLNNLEIAKNNEVMLQKVLRYHRIGVFINVAKWVIIIGSAIGAFYFLQPFLDTLYGTYQTLINSTTSVIEYNNGMNQ